MCHMCFLLSFTDFSENFFFCVLRKLLMTLRCMDTLILVRPSPFALTLSHGFTWEKRHTQHLQLHQSQHRREKQTVNFLFLWGRSMQCQWGWGEWRAELLEQAVTQSLWVYWVYEKQRKAACKLKQTCTFGCLFKTALEGKSVRNTETGGGRKISVNLFKLVWEFEKGGRRGRERERETEKKREEHGEKLYCAENYFWLHEQIK